MKVLKNHILTILTSVVLFCGTAFSQVLTYQTTNTPVQLVQNILAGAGVTATNITFNGSAVTANAVQTSARSFTATGFPFLSGVYLRTAGGASVASDPDLQAIASGNPTNGAKLEFDFIATGNDLSFNYIFASSEYSNYTCSGFNDAFGFFLSGPGIAGPYSLGAVNLAVIPGGNIPVTINSVNSGSPTGGNSPAGCAAIDPNWQANTIYYNPTAYGGFSGEGYNGSTISMIAASDLICGETYHIKLAVCNVLDQALNSGVYLEAGSFTTNPINFTFNTFTLDNTIYEGCNQLGTLMFTREGCGNENDTLIAYTTFSGTAINGVDYNFLGAQVVLLPGVDTVYWQIIPIEDGLIEGVEQVIITIMTILPTGDTLYTSGTFLISDVPTININPVDKSFLCYKDNTNITATVTGGFAPYQYLWENGATTTTTNVPLGGNGVTYQTVTITDACGYTATDSVMITMNQTISIDSIIMGPATCEPVGYVSAFISGQTNPINVVFDWTNAADTTIVYPDQSALPNLYGGWYILTLTDDNIPCSVTDSILVETIDTPQAIGSVSPDSGCSPLSAVFSNSSQNATSYTWDFGNGNVVTVGNTNPITQTYTSNSTITLTASNGFPNCDNTISLSIQIIECGCTNPIALNYNPLAVQDDGSCILPTPTVIAPNVFTANGDAINAYFFLQTTNAEKIEFTIINRWGNLIYTAAGTELMPPLWDGRDKSGNPVEDGVYFYSYVVTGIAGGTLEGHGFVEVIR